jgi:5-methyltetrahydropteroyltriglutamate--homocysteine methyltransferase
MTQQAQNDHYATTRSLALAYADAVNEELRDLKAAGADVVQIDEPYLQARPEAAREYASRRSTARSTGIDGDTVLHTCFGYAAIVHDRPSGYPFLAELNDCAATHVSLEAAQRTSTRKCSGRSPTRRSCSGCSTSAPATSRRPSVWPSGCAGRSRSSSPERSWPRLIAGMKYLPRDRAFAKLQAMVAGARSV